MKPSLSIPTDVDVAPHGKEDLSARRLIAPRRPHNVLFRSQLYAQVERRLWGVAILLIVVLHAPVSATSVIVIREPDRLTIGADRALSDLTGGRVGAVCKIVPTRYGVFGLAGFFDYPSLRFLGGPAGSGLIANAIAAGDQGLTPADALKTFISFHESTLNSYLLSQMMKPDLPRIDQPLRNLGDALFIASEPDAMRVRGVRFVIRPKPDAFGRRIGHLDLECPPMCRPDYAPIAIGEDSEVLAAWEQMDPAIRRDPVLAVQDLLAIQMFAAIKAGRPESIRGPFDVLQVTRTGAQWRKRQSDCRDVP